MPVTIRHAKKVYKGLTTADLARMWGITPQSAEKRTTRPGFPVPLATITTEDADGRTVKVTKVWDPADFRVFNN